MPTRAGREYIEGLREQRREVWLRGERDKNVTTQSVDLKVWPIQRRLQNQVRAHVLLCMLACYVERRDAPGARADPVQ
jgi:hypothetical protein